MRVFHIIPHTFPHKRWKDSYPDFPRTFSVFLGPGEVVTAKRNQQLMPIGNQFDVFCQGAISEDAQRTDSRGLDIQGFQQSFALPIQWSVQNEQHANRCLRAKEFPFSATVCSALDESSRDVSRAREQDQKVLIPGLGQSLQEMSAR